MNEERVGKHFLIEKPCRRAQQGGKKPPVPRRGEHPVSTIVGSRCSLRRRSLDWERRRVARICLGTT